MTASTTGPSKPSKTSYSSKKTSKTWNSGPSNGSEILSEVHKAKYLGITLSDTLSWSPYVSETVNKASGMIAFLRRNLHQCPQRLKEQAYLMLVRSVLEYTASVWDPHLKRDVNALEGVQRRSARFVTNNYERTSSVTAMLKSLGWESLQDRRRDIRLAQVAVPTDDLLVKADSRTRANHKHKFRHIPATSAAYKHSFFPWTVPQWNSLPAKAVAPPPSAPMSPPCSSPSSH